MKKIITAIAISLGLISASASAAFDPCPLNETVFYGQTANGKKSVTICKVGFAYRYTFSKADGTMEKDIIEDADKVEFDVGGGRMSSISTVMFPSGNTKYQVGWVQPEDEEGEYSITVWQKTKQLAVIKLNPNTVISNISDFAK